MKLSREQFQDIISHLVSDRSDRVGEKRREPRVGVRFEAVVTPLTPDETGIHKMPMFIRDISPSGINVLSHRNMPRKMEFILELRTSDESAFLIARYEVRHCKVLSETLFSVGAKLICLTDEDRREPDPVAK